MKDLESTWTLLSRRAELAQRSSHEVLIRHGWSRYRVTTVKDLMQHLESVPVDINSYFREAIGCLEHDFRRAAVVLSWAGFYGVFSEHLFNHHLEKLKSTREKWKLVSIEDLKEKIESQVLEAAKMISVLSKADERILQGLLAKRNQCAHPSLLVPSINDTIGYLDQTLSYAIRFV